MAEDKPSSTASSRAFALLQVLALNGVTLYGVYFLGWSWGTALVLYPVVAKIRARPPRGAFCNTRFLAGHSSAGGGHPR